MDFSDASCPLRLTLFGQPQVSVTFDDARYPETHSLPGDDWVLLLVFLAYFGERDYPGGSVERGKIESAWRDARSKAERSSPSYFEYKADGAVRNATRDLRRYFADLSEGTPAEGEEIVEVTGKGLLRLNPQWITSDISDFFRLLRQARGASLPEEADEVRDSLTAAQRILEEGEFLPGFEHRFGRFEIAENGSRLESWVLDARSSLQAKQNQTAERLVKLAPFLLLPSYENAFVPRPDLAVEIRDWLFERIESSGSRLPALVLHGGYGAGKTRLAVETVRSLTVNDALSLYPEGISFLPLDSYFSSPGTANETRFLQAIAQTLRIPDPIQQKLTGHNTTDFYKWIGARPKRLLLLDNGESLYSDIMAKALTRLLHATDGRLRCLLTSRAAWPGLRHLPVEGLALPASPDDSFEAFAGSRLFLERVRQRDPNYTIPDPGLLLTALEQTDGLPLNIELLAGRAWDKGVEGLRTLVEQRRLSLLSLQGPDPPDGPPTSAADRRHRSAAASIFWSIDRLPDIDREKFIHLAVFPYDWDVTAAAAICGASEDDLRGWRDLYLATYDRLRDRWLLRPRIREVVQELFAQDGAAAEIMRTKHRDFYLPVAEAADARMKTIDVKSALDTFQQEMPNVQTVMAFCLEQEDRENGLNALRTANSLQKYYFVGGRDHEALSLLKDALAHPGAISISVERVCALDGLLHIYANRFAHPEQATEYREELEECLPNYHLEGKGSALCAVASCYIVEENFEKAISILDEAEEIFRIEQDFDGFGRIYTNRGLIDSWRANHIHDTEELSQIRRSILRWMTLARESILKTGEITRLAHAYSNEGSAACEALELGVAYRAIQSGLRLAFRHDLPIYIHWFMNVTGSYCFRCKRYEEAVRIWECATNFFTSQGASGLNPSLIPCLYECRERIGETKYNRETEIGRGWSVEQAVEYALSIPPPPPES